MSNTYNVVVEAPGAINVAEAAASATAAAASASQADAAAMAAGAPIVTTLTSPTPANGTTELLKTDYGLELWEVVSGSWANQGSVGPANLFTPEESFVQNAQVNVLESGLTACVIMAGDATFPNQIGVPNGLPSGPSFTPTGWTADTAYVAGSAVVANIVGGHGNIVNQIAGSVVGSGGHNFLKYDTNGHSIVGGGSYHVIAAGYSGIFSGRRNTITGGGDFNVIAGGDDNNIVGSYSAIVGGNDIDINGNNSMAGGTGHSLGGSSFAFGNNVAASAQSGVVAFTDSNLTTFTVSTDNIFAARFANGYRFIGGNMAIGASDWAPTRDLEVRGTVAFSNSDDSGALFFSPGASKNSLFSRAGHASSTGVTFGLSIGSSEVVTVNTNSRVGINETSPDYRLDVNGTFGFTPGSSVTPVDNGDVVFELTSDTSLTIKAKGSDGNVRSVVLTLA